MMLPARLCGRLNRMLSSTEKYLVTSVHFSNHRCVPLISKCHTPNRKIPHLMAIITSEFRCVQKDFWQTNLDNNPMLSSCCNQFLHRGASLSSVFTSLLERPLNQYYPSVVNSLYRGFHTRQQISIDDEEDEEAKQKLQKKDDESKEYAAWMLRMSNENNYLSWCRNIYISTLVAYTTSILAPGHFSAEGVFIVIAFANLFFGTTSFIYHTIRMRQKMRMGVIGVLYNVLLALIHFLLYVTCISMYAPFNVEFIDDPDGSTDDV